MAHATESLERAEHAAHGGHGGHHEGGGLSLRVGITMAILGVLLAFAAARVGYERAELLQYLVEQQHAHAKYQAQDIKHRTAVLSLEQLHALSAAGTKVNGPEMVAIATGVNRYFAEAQAAKAWVDSYDPVVAAHSDAQEEFEHAQLAAELGIVLASIAIILKRKEPWAIGILLGIACVVLIGMTYWHTAHALAGSMAKVDEAEKTYRTLRESGKTTQIDQALVDEVLQTYGAK